MVGGASEWFDPGLALHFESQFQKYFQRVTEVSENELEVLGGLRAAEQPFECRSSVPRRLVWTGLESSRLRSRSNPDRRQIGLALRV